MEKEYKFLGMTENGIEVYGCLFGEVDKQIEMVYKINGEYKHYKEFSFKDLELATKACDIFIKCV